MQFANCSFGLSNKKYNMELRAFAISLGKIHNTKHKTTWKIGKVRASFYIYDNISRLEWREKLLQDIENQTDAELLFVYKVLSYKVLWALFFANRTKGTNQNTVKNGERFLSWRTHTHMPTSYLSWMCVHSRSLHSKPPLLVPAYVPMCFYNHAKKLHTITNFSRKKTNIFEMLANMLNNLRMIKLKYYMKI